MLGVWLRRRPGPKMQLLLLQLLMLLLLLQAATFDQFLRSVGLSSSLSLSLCIGRGLFNFSQVILESFWTEIDK